MSLELEANAESSIVDILVTLQRNMADIRPFHLAFPVIDIDDAREFYTGVLGCGVGRESEQWIDFDLYGHQIVAHRVDEMPKHEKSLVEDKEVSSMHFGVILNWDDWHKLANRLKEAGLEFIVEPHTRYIGKPGEHATMFLNDPSGNNLEFKAFRDDTGIFAKQQ